MKIGLSTIISLQAYKMTSQMIYVIRKEITRTSLAASSSLEELHFSSTSACYNIPA